MSKHFRSTSFTRFILIAVVLSILFASRVQFLTDIPLNRDEARSGMRMMGSIEEVIAWQPPDWPPLHNVLLSVWSQAAGEYPFSLRVFSAFFSLLSVCFAYWMAYTLTHDRRVAWGTMIIYAGLGLGIHLGVFIRGYVLVIALLPLAIGLTVRYFTRHRKRDAVYLAITLGVMFISTYTVVPAFAFLGLLTLILYPRQIWRWIPVGILASPFALLELLRKWDYWVGRFGSGSASSGPGYDFFLVFTEHYQDYFGQFVPVWIAIMAVALVLIVWKARHQSRLLVWVVISSLLAPVVTFFLVESRIFVLMSSRYSWWVLIALAMGIGLGLRYLPKIVWLGVLAGVTAMMFTLPLGPTYYTEDEFAYHYEDNMEWLRQHVEPGDAILFDPNYCINDCFDQDTLAYFWDVYLGDSVIKATEIGDHRRIWLWRGIGHSRDLLAELEETHVQSTFYGPPIALLELYEAPPNPEGILFENGMRFHGYEVLRDDGHLDLPPYNVREQSTMQIRLWWSADKPIDNDYQVSIQIHDSNKGSLFLNNDNSPQLIHLKSNAFEPLPQRVSEWSASRYYVEERVIAIPDTTMEVYADLYLVVYHLSDGERVSADGVTEDQLLPLADAIIWGWG